MKAIVSLCFVLPALFGTTQAAPPDKNAPQLLIEARLIEVNDEAMDSLAPFAATGATPSISGMLKDDQLSSLWNKIETTKGVDILSMPRVTACSGQEAKVEMGREFAYAEASGKPAMKQLGTLLKVLPRIEGLNDIDLEVSLQIAGLEGMRKDADSGFEQPVFNERKAVARVTISSGQTVVFGLPPTLTKQTTVDSSPGGVLTKTKDVKRHTMVFVTANIAAHSAYKPLEPSR